MTPERERPARPYSRLPTIRRRAWLRPLSAGDLLLVESVLLAIGGALLGSELARSSSNRILPGSAWSATTEATRTALATIFGVQMTVVGIVLTLNVLVLQVAASQYSPRLQSLYAVGASVRRGILFFAFSAAYALAAVFVLGLTTTREASPRPVVAGAFLLLVGFIGVLTYDLLATFASVRLEVVLRSLTKDGIEAFERVRAEQQRVGAEVAPAELPAESTPLLAHRSGYIVDVDLVGLVADASARRVVVRVDRWIGDFVGEGEIVGWIASEDEPSPDLPGDFARALRIARARRPHRDVGLALRLLVDIADRALSPGINDPYTARQALNACRVVLCRLARTPLGDCVVRDAGGRTRVSVACPTLRDHLSLVVDGPARFGAGDGDTMDGLLAIAREVAMVAVDSRGRECAWALAHRVLGEARARGGIDPDRLQLIETSITELERTIEAGRPSSDAHPAWGMADLRGPRSTA